MHTNKARSFLHAVTAVLLMIPCQGWSQPSQTDSLTNYLSYLGTLRDCVIDQDLDKCADAVDGKLLDSEEKAVEEIQDDIESACIGNIGGGTSGAFDCYLTWLAGAFDTVTKRIMDHAGARQKALGNALYVACRNNPIANTPEDKAKRCVASCKSDNALGCKVFKDICMKTDDRDAMEVCTDEGIDLSANPHF